jgi:hypothetical protein
MTDGDDFLAFLDVLRRALYMIIRWIDVRLGRNV